MGKTLRKLGLGLALGAAAGHYLATEKGQKLLAQVKKGLESYQANPEAYQEDARTFFSQQLENVKRLFDDNDQVFKTKSDTSAEVGDIIITYTEDDLN